MAQNASQFLGAANGVILHLFEVVMSRDHPDGEAPRGALPPALGLGPGLGAIANIGERAQAEAIPTLAELL